MTIFKLLKAREATSLKAEDYKVAIRKYMETIGYAQVTDSYVEGHFPDMVFLPQAKMPWPEVWVEAKARKVSLSDTDFVDEVRRYLHEWLEREPSARFKLMIFVIEVSNPSRWETIWGSKLTDQAVAKWLEVHQENSEKASGFMNNRGEIVSFFSETTIVIGDEATLMESVSAKLRVGMTAMEVRTRAREQLRLMEQRSKPIPQRSNLISNLMVLGPPARFLILHIDPLPAQEIWNLMRRRESPPYSIVTKGTLVTFEVDEAETRFASLHPSGSEKIELSELESLYPQSLPQLVNRAISDVVRPLGVGQSNQWYYFMASREIGEQRNRVIETGSGETLQVAKPLYLKPETNTLADKKVLNFVFHQAFNLRYRKLWDTHFVQFRLRRLFTSDGVNVIDRDRASAIDAYFRNPLFNRSETQQRKFSILGRFLFHTFRPSQPGWVRQLRFGEFLKLQTNWTPESVDIDQTLIEQWEEEIEVGNLD